MSRVRLRPHLTPASAARLPGALTLGRRQRRKPGVQNLEAAEATCGLGASWSTPRTGLRKTVDTRWLKAAGPNLTPSPLQSLPPHSVEGEITGVPPLEGPRVCFCLLGASQQRCPSNSPKPCVALESPDVTCSDAQQLCTDTETDRLSLAPFVPDTVLGVPGGKSRGFSSVGPRRRWG